MVLLAHLLLYGRGPRLLRIDDSDIDIETAIDRDLNPVATGPADDACRNAGLRGRREQTLEPLSVGRHHHARRRLAVERGVDAEEIADTRDHREFREHANPTRVE